MSAMDSFLITVDGSEHEISPNVRAGPARHFRPLLAGPGRRGQEPRRTALLRDTFGFHPLAIQDAEHFGQRPKIDSYDDFTLMVVYGVTSSGHLVEVHCFYTENYLVTAHRVDSPS